MRILYGVNGEGMGHATRSRVVIDSLLQNHDVRVVSSGNAYAFLTAALPHVDEIFGLSFAMDHGPDPPLGDGGRERALAWPRAAEHRPRVAGANARVAPRRRDHRLRAARAPPTRAGAGRRWSPSTTSTCSTAAITTRRSSAPSARTSCSPRRSPTRWSPGRSSTWSRPSSSRRSPAHAPRWCRRSCGPRSRPRRSERGEHLVVYASDDPALTDALRASGVPCRVYGMRGGPEADHDRRQPRVPPALGRPASSRTCERRGAWSPGVASRCSARPSTSASRCSRSRCGDSSSS